ncbi:MAG: hypothetical protein IJQ11_03275 [Bacteroidales bacterium]|nr:hypothetical protein [Bacteroidales bacterium]
MSQDTSHLTFGAYLKAYFKQCLEALKHPKMLLPTAILAVVWIGLGILQNKVGRNLPLSILNFLTFAQGGLYGGILGAVGGILGKIVVAAFVNVMIVPLFYKKNPFANLKGGFNDVIQTVKFESTEAFVSLLKGFGAALLLYSIFNVTQSLENSLVGIVSAVALISAVARKGGFLWGLVLSWLNTVSKGKKVSYQQVLRVLTGMTFGFALGVVLSAAGSMWAGSLGIIALIVGWIMGRGTKKEAVAHVILIALFLLPKAELWASGSGKWTLVDVKTEITPTASWTGIHDEHVSVTLSGTTASYRIDYVFRDDAGYFTGEITPFYGSYAPGYVFVGEGATHLEKGSRWLDISAYHKNEFWTSYSGVDRDKGGWIGWELRDDLGTFNYTFPTREEVGSDQFIIEESVNLHGAYIRTAYYFEWNSKRKAVSGADGSDDDWDDDIDISLPKWIDKLFGTDGHHTPDGVTILIGVLGALGGLGGGLGGALGGGIGGGGNVPTGEGPTGSNGPAPENEPTPEELEWQRYQKEKQGRFNKYVHDNPDGTKTYTDPATGEKHTLYPRYNEETGKPEGWVNENDSHYDEDKLNDWLAWRERNSEHFAQNEAEAQQSLAQQRAMNQAQNDYDRERGSSAAADAHKAYKEECEKEVYLTDLALKHGFINADDKDALKKALLKDKHEALEEGAEAMKDAAFWNDAVNYAETTERIADTTINVMGEFPGNRGVKNFYTVAKTMAKHGMQGAVKGQGWGVVAKELGVGAVEGGLNVLQNQEMTGVFGTSALGKLAKAGVNIGAESAKSIVNDLMDPNKSASEILDNATKAGFNRLYFEGMGEITKAYGGLASDANQASIDEVGSFAQEMGFHNDSSDALAEKINHFRHKFFGI